MFSTEKDLVSAFKNVASDFLRCSLEKYSSPFFLIEEFDSHFGIADIVLGTSSSIDQDYLSRKTISWNWVLPIFNLSKNQEVDLNSFMKTYCISESTARSKLKEYSEAGFLLQTSKGSYKVVREYEIITDKIISIEAKLRNWQKALQQALRYKKFSNSAYVLLDSKHIRPALKNIHFFKEKNIGLMSMNMDNYTIHYTPKINATSQTASFFRLNEAVFDCFKGQEAFA